MSCRSLGANGSSAGTAIITFGTGSYATAASQHVTVHPTPYVIGSTTICPGSPITMSVTPSSGTWASDNPSILSIHSATGVVSYVSSAWTHVDYVSLAGFPRNDYAVYSGANISLTGSSTFDVCEGSKVGFTGTPSGGVWFSSNPSRLSINVSDGSAYGNSPGTLDITYTTAGTCTQTRTVNVKPQPRLCKLTSKVKTGESIGSWFFFTSFGFAWKFPSWDHRMRVWGVPGGGTFVPSSTVEWGDIQNGAVYCLGTSGERITLKPISPHIYSWIEYTVNGRSVHQNIVTLP